VKKTSKAYLISYLKETNSPTKSKELRLSLRKNKDNSNSNSRNSNKRKIKDMMITEKEIKGQKERAMKEISVPQESKINTRKDLNTNKFNKFSSLLNSSNSLT
jgi:hypothetical protein